VCKIRKELIGSVQDKKKIDIKVLSGLNLKKIKRKGGETVKGSIVGL